MRRRVVPRVAIFLRNNIAFEMHTQPEAPSGRISNSRLSVIYALCVNPKKLSRRSHEIKTPGDAEHATNTLGHHDGCRSSIGDNIRCIQCIRRESSGCAAVKASADPANKLQTRPTKGPADADGGTLAFLVNSQRTALGRRARSSCDRIGRCRRPLVAVRRKMRGLRGPLAGVSRFRPGSAISSQAATVLGACKRDERASGTAPHVVARRVGESMHSD